VDFVVSASAGRFAGAPGAPTGHTARVGCSADGGQPEDWAARLNEYAAIAAKTIIETLFTWAFSRQMNVERMIAAGGAGLQIRTLLKSLCGLRAPLSRTLDAVSWFAQPVARESGRLAQSSLLKSLRS
jgi:hypothetical protein